MTDWLSYEWEQKRLEERRPIVYKFVPSNIEKELPFCLVEENSEKNCLPAEWIKIYFLIHLKSHMIYVSRTSRYKFICKNPDIQW